MWGKRNGPPGCRVLAGGFDLTPEQVAASASDHFTLLAAFRSKGTALVGTFNGRPTNLSGGFSARATVDSSVASGRRIHLWAFHAPSPGLASSHVRVSSSAWIMPGCGSLLCGVAAVPDARPAAVRLVTRVPGALAPTLGGILNQAIPLTFTRRAGTGGITDFATPGIHDVGETSANRNDWRPLDASELVSWSGSAAAAGLERLTWPPLADSAAARFWWLRVGRR